MLCTKHSLSSVELFLFLDMSSATFIVTELCFDTRLFSVSYPDLKILMNPSLKTFKILYEYKFVSPRSKIQKHPLEVFCEERYS